MGQMSPIICLKLVFAKVIVMLWFLQVSCKDFKLISFPPTWYNFVTLEIEGYMRISSHPIYTRYSEVSKMRESSNSGNIMSPANSQHVFPIKS